MNQAEKQGESTEEVATEKSKRFKDIKESEEWKSAHLADKKEVEIHRDEWKRKYYESDKKVIALAKKNLRLTEELEAMEKDDLSKRTITGQDEIDERKKKEQEKRLTSFLGRIK